MDKIERQRNIIESIKNHIKEHNTMTMEVFPTEIDMVLECIKTASSEMNLPLSINSLKPATRKLNGKDITGIAMTIIKEK